MLVHAAIVPIRAQCLDRPLKSPTLERIYTNNILLVVAKLEDLKRDMKFIGQMANITFTASEEDTDTLGR